MTPSALSIGFLLGSPDISGGTYVIFEHATHLQDFGHTVSIITEQSVAPNQYEWHPKARQLHWINYGEAEGKQFDVVIATWWKSPFLLSRFNSSHHAYFVQSIESRFFLEDDPTDHDERDLSIWKQYCESTYSCNIPVITEASWIKQYLHEHYHRNAILVKNGIRKDIYSQQGTALSPRQNGKLRVLVEGPVDVGFKNVPTSIALAQEAGADEIWLLTSSDIEHFPGVDRVFSRVPIHDTPAIYRSCDVLVKLSYIEGMFGPPLEMFHCGGTAIVYDVTGHDEYIIHNQNSYVVTKDDNDEVVNYLKKLKNSPDELQRLIEGARLSADEWHDWHSAAKQFEDALRVIFSHPPTNLTYLTNWTTAMEAENLERLAKREIFRFQEREEGEAVPDHHNFIQLYSWAEADGLEKGVFTWAHYRSGERVTVTLETDITGFPFWVRIDPSVRIGAFEIFSISVVNSTSGETVYECDQVEQFGELYFTGTLKRLDVPGRVLFLAYGDDPQCIIPAITEGKAGDTLKVSIEILETGISAAVSSLPLLAEKGSASKLANRLRRFFS